MNNKKGILTAILCIVFVLYSVLPAVAGDIIKDVGFEDMPPPNITAQAAMVINLNTGLTVYEKNSTDVIYPASTVKLMTGILVLEAIKDFDMQIAASEYAVSLTGGNNISAKAGEVFSARDLIYALLIYAANDAANILAETVGGTIQGFIDMMNAKALEIGCENTVYANPSGLHDNSMHTTAADTAKIAAYASKIDEFVNITSTSSYTVEPTNLYSATRTLTNRNHLVSKASQTQYYYEPAKGLNAGGTSEAGNIVVSIASKSSVSYLCVIMGSTDTPTGQPGVNRTDSFVDAKAMFEWAFTLFGYKTIVASGDLIREEKVQLAAKEDYITLVSETAIEALLPSFVNISRDIERSYRIYDDMLCAPIEKGTVLGEMYLLYNGELIGKTNLIANSKIERSNILYSMENIKNAVSTRWFKASVVSFVIFITIYILISVIGYNKKRRRD